MPKVLVSNNPELLRHFTAPPFQRLELELLVAATADEVRALVRKDKPALVVIDAEPSGFDATRDIKTYDPSIRVILVAGRQLLGDQMRQVSACGCDELLIAPMTAGELHDVVAIQLGEPRPGTEAFSVAVELAGRKVDATVSNLSLDGVRLVVGEPVAEGQVLEISIIPEGEAAARVRGTAVWAQPREGKTVVGVAFDRPDDRARAVLAKLTQWQVVKDG
ncbi:MAG TPA: PilZ domain-containing protein, partial [Kofleriaceae bacterium]|nr:PilZ domain-containing protein [Kofleriaceae bacterium]